MSGPQLTPEEEQEINDLAVELALAMQNDGAGAVQINVDADGHVTNITIYVVDES